MSAQENIGPFDNLERSVTHVSSATATTIISLVTIVVVAVVGALFLYTNTANNPTTASETTVTHPVVQSRDTANVNSTLQPPAPTP